MTSWLPVTAGRVRLAFLTRGDEVTDVRQLPSAVDAHGVVTAMQMHGARNAVVSHESIDREHVDALITKMPELALTIKCADCQSFALYAADQHVLAVVHAGWRGLAQKIISATVDTLHKKFSAHPSQIYAWAGPSLCVDCAEFSNPFEELPKHLHPFIVNDKHVDLQKAADAELMACGMPLDHLVRHPDCTKHMEHLYWSHRAKNDEAAQKEGKIIPRNFLVACLAQS